ncbi:MAG TPA: hypothetical protein VHK28_00870 [Candidatus Limnocylindria bacterium]|nr:hypothetical protein [Candidatus Limnocylindria bacterium]
MTAPDGWVCKVCWKWNRAQDERCYKCKTVRGADEAQVEEQRKELEARKAKTQEDQPESVPDALVAVPVIIFRGYSKAWLRGGIGTFGFLVLLGLGGVTDLGWVALTAIIGAGLVICGLMAGEVAEGMRNREVWAYLAGIALSVVGGVGSVFAFNTFVPGLVSESAVRWGSLIVFGGAAIAAAAGLVMLWRAPREETGGSPS